jgi:hypothetical protein
MTVQNRAAKFFIEIVYLVIPGLLFYAPFHEGEYSFYTLLRVLVFIFCVYIALITLLNQEGYYANPKSKYPIIFGAIAVIFNPIIPIHLDRDVWGVIDFIAGFFIMFYFIERKVFHRTNGKMKKVIKEREDKIDEEHKRIKSLKWCKTCKYYKKNKKYSNTLDGLYRNESKPNEIYLPCANIVKTKKTWERFYEMIPNKRTLFPNDCTEWEKR